MEAEKLYVTPLYVAVLEALFTQNAAGQEPGWKARATRYFPGQGHGPVRLRDPLGASAWVGSSGEEHSWRHFRSFEPGEWNRDRGTPGDGGEMSPRKPRCLVAWKIRRTNEGSRTKPEPSMRSFLLYAEATLLTLAIVFAALDLRHADLRIPLYYSMGSDVHFILGMIKSVADTGWYFENPWLGARGAQDLRLPVRRDGDLPGSQAVPPALPRPLPRRQPLLSRDIRPGLVDVVVRTAEVRSPGPGGRGGEPPVRVHALPSLERHGESPPLRVLPDPSRDNGEPVAEYGATPGLRPERSGPGATGLAAGRTLPVLVTAVLVSMGGPSSAYFGTFLLVVGGFIGFVRKPSWTEPLTRSRASGWSWDCSCFKSSRSSSALHRQGRVQTTVTRTMDDYYVHALRLENLIRPTVGRRLALAQPALDIRARREPE